MILDKGICTIYEVGNIAAPGNMPKNGLANVKHKSWYGELSFETVPYNAAMQDMTEVSARVRILQNRSINNQDVAILSDSEAQYEITRAYHGIDEDSGELITDLSLRKLVNAYDIADEITGS